MKYLSIGLIVLFGVALVVYGVDYFLYASPFLGGAVGYLIGSIAEDKIERDYEKETR